MILAQISDTHINEPDTLVYGAFDTTTALHKAVELLNRMDPGPDIVLHTGDIAAHGSVERYRYFNDIVSQLNVPLYVIPGNHDDRDAMREAFGTTCGVPADGTFLHYTVDDFAVRLVCCDSVIAGESGGALCAERLEWLNEQLSSAPERPTIVALHHPPFYSGMTGSTAKGLKTGGQEFANIIRQHPQVVRVLAGHVHRPMTTRFGGTIAFAGPTTCYPFGLDMGPARELNITGEPPGIAVHLWLDEATPDGSDLVSHILPIGDWGPSTTLLKDGKVVAALA